MKVNLKKAAALAAALSATSVKFDHSYGVDLYGDVPTEEMVAKAREELTAQVEASLAIVQTAFLIRAMIGKANEGRINALLTTRASVDKQLAVLNTLPVRQQGTNLAALGRQIEALRVGENKIYGVKAPNLELETASIVSPILSQLRRKKRELDEELQAVNFNTTIELPEDVVAVLTRLDLV